MLRTVAGAMACAAAFAAHGAPAAPRAPDPAASMHARFAAMRAAPGGSPFNRPLHMASSETGSAVSGEIYAVLDHAFAIAGAALDEPAEWCDVLILHLNTKHCRSSGEGAGAVLHLGIGKKHDTPVADAYRLDFAYRVAARTATYLQVTLGAGEGPLGTRDYRIVLEATPAEGGRTLVRLAYSYRFGTVGRVAMQAYLRTSGRDKVGFTKSGTTADGKPHYVDGMRGVVERNTMRYFIAIEAFLGALAAPPQARLEKRLHAWFAGNEAYPRQLREVSQGEYLDMKRREHSRQQVGAAPG
jgi:hypothetical protein